jgi:hypothetical protein
MREEMNNQSNEEILPGQDLISLIQQINKATRNSGSEENMMRAAEEIANLLAPELKCSSKQAVLFSIVLNLNLTDDFVTLT